MFEQICIVSPFFWKIIVFFHIVFQKKLFQAVINSRRWNFSKRFSITKFAYVVVSIASYIDTNNVNYFFLVIAIMRETERGKELEIKNHTE